MYNVSHNRNRNIVVESLLMEEFIVYVISVVSNNRYGNIDNKISKKYRKDKHRGVMF